MSDRKVERVLIKKDVLINERLKAHALDISDGGMYIQTEADFNPGSVIELRFDVDDEPVKVKARIQHVQLGVGIGVKFIGLSHEDATRIKRLLEKFQRISPVEVSGKKKVLLIDNDVRSKSVYKMRLLRDDFTVFEASNYLEAVKLLQESKPDIVVLDLWQEGMDGFNILQLMQINPDLRIIPVLILSTRNVATDVEKAMALGAKDYLLKMTTTPIKLSEKIKAILEGS